MPRASDEMTPVTAQLVCVSVERRCPLIFVLCYHLLPSLPRIKLCKALITSPTLSSAQQYSGALAKEVERLKRM